MLSKMSCEKLEIYFLCLLSIFFSLNPPNGLNISTNVFILYSTPIGN